MDGTRIDMNLSRTLDDSPQLGVLTAFCISTAASPWPTAWRRDKHTSWRCTKLKTTDTSWKKCHSDNIIYIRICKDSKLLAWLSNGSVLFSSSCLLVKPPIYTFKVSCFSWNFSCRFLLLETCKKKTGTTLTHFWELPSFPPQVLWETRTPKWWLIQPKQNSIF